MKLGPPVQKPSIPEQVDHLDRTGWQARGFEPIS